VCLRKKGSLTKQQEDVSYRGTDVDTFRKVKKKRDTIRLTTFD